MFNPGNSYVVKYPIFHLRPVLFIAHGDTCEYFPCSPVFDTSLVPPPAALIHSPHLHCGPDMRSQPATGHRANKKTQTMLGGPFKKKDIYTSEDTPL